MKRFLLFLIRFYRRAISPYRPPCCRFIPTCSQYALEAIEKYGAVKGGWLAFKRIMRCNRALLREARVTEVWRRTACGRGIAAPSEERGG